MATKIADYTKMMQDMMGSFPVDMSAFQDAFKTQAASRREDVEGRPRSRREVDRDLDKWTKDTLAKIGDVTKVKPSRPTTARR
jgi:hypothetical protein